MFVIAYCFHSAIWYYLFAGRITTQTRRITMTYFIINGETDERIATLVYATAEIAKAVIAAYLRSNPEYSDLYYSTNSEYASSSFDALVA